MNIAVTLKQLRNDPREYIRLLKNGYEVEITEHRKTVVKTVQVGKSNAKSIGDVQSLLHLIETVPPIVLVNPSLDTASAVKQAKRNYLQKKYA